MLRTVGICVLVIIVLLVIFALLSRFNWNPLDRIATPSATTATTTTTTAAAP